MAAVYRYHCQSGLFITLLHLMITHSWWLCVYYYEMYIVDTIMHDGCEMSTRPSFFELDLPCFWIRPSLFWLGPTVFRVRLSHFSGQSFPKSVLLIFRVSPSDFSKPVLLIFRVRPFHFFGSVLPNFLSQSFSFFDSDVPFFLSQSCSFFDSDLLPIFFTVSFRLLPVLCSGLIAMCNVDKIKDVGVCRKRLDCTTNTLARETNQKNTNRQARKTKKETELKWLLK